LYWSFAEVRSDAVGFPRQLNEEGRSGEALKKNQNTERSQSGK